MNDSAITKEAIGRRLEAVREALKYRDRPALAAVLGISAHRIGQFERGERAPDLETLSRYHAMANVDLNWLVTGEGEMLSAPAAVVVGREADLLAGFRKLPDDRQLDLLEILAMNLKRVGR